MPEERVFCRAAPSGTPFVHCGTAFVLDIPFSFGPAHCFKEV